MKLEIGRIKILRGGQPALNVLFHGFRANDKACVEYTNGTHFFLQASRTKTGF